MAEAFGARWASRPRLWRSRTSWVGAALVCSLGLLALAAPFLAPHDPAGIDPLQRLLGPSWRYPLGTDHLGRDVLSRLLFGARWSLGSAVLVTALTTGIGTLLGAVAGYHGGRLDALLMRVVDVFLALPGLLLALAVVGVLGPGLRSILIALVSVGWASYARLVRGMVLELREAAFVEAARGLGFRHSRVLLRHVLPNVFPSVLVPASLELGEVVLAVAALSFLGLGAQPPTPEWGAMLNDGRPFLLSAPHLMLYPGLAITLVAIGFNLLGEGLRDALDPRTYYPARDAREARVQAGFSR